MTPAVAMDYPLPTPRDYQSESVDNFFRDGGDGIIQIFTGGGKTLTAGIISKRMPGRDGGLGRTLFLAHTDELVRQTCRTMFRVGLWPFVEKADEYRGEDYRPDQRERRKLFPDKFPPHDWFQFNRICVSSMQTFVGRVEDYRDDWFDTLIIDEGHRSNCSTYRKILGRLRAFNPAMRLLLLSATPYRADGKGLLASHYFHRMRMVDGIDQGYLVPIRCEQGVAQGIDESVWQVGNTKQGRDITDGSLSRSMDNRQCIESIAHEIIEKGEGRKGIVFLPSIKVAESVTAALNALRPGVATFVHGKVPKEERKKRVRMHEDGKVELMVGVMAMTEGYDVPDVSLVVLARATKSRGLVEQKIGRGMRVLAECIEGKHTAEERRAAIAASAKRDLLVLDFSNSSRHRLATTEDVLVTSSDPKVVEYVKKHRAPSDKRQVREQLEELEAVYEFEEAMRAGGGIPAKAQFNYRHIDLFGVGGYQKAESQAKQDVRRPTTELVNQAHDVMVPKEKAEGMTHNQLLAEVAKRRETRVGRKLFGFLVWQCGIDRAVIDTLRLNWHEANYLKRLTMARPNRKPPHDWQDHVLNYRKDRKAGRVK